MMIVLPTDEEIEARFEALANFGSERIGGPWTTTTEGRRLEREEWRSMAEGIHRAASVTTTV